MVISEKSLERSLLPILCFGAAANALLPGAIEAATNSGLIGALTAGLGHSFVVWICLGLAVRLSLHPTRLSMSYGAWLLTLLLSALLLIPSAIVAWLTCIAFCALWYTQAERHRHADLAIFILAATASREPICQSFLHLFAAQILHVDAWVSGALLKLLAIPATVAGNTITQESGHSLLVLTGCSAFTNLSYALLLWMSFTLFRHGAITHQDMLRAAVMLVLIFATNSLRLAMMTLDPFWYETLHSEHSEEILECLSIGIALLSVKRSNPYESHSDCPDTVSNVDSRAS
ncbi:archaeosortase/exosortase family protein [Neptunomonas sp. XY-337]|uniref:archaeosortase/exosortase family protein n=1 Tax=Neptunomonas sp. XY-337 TaxID=2561897 RepID=UPI0010A9F3FE|nr:archaeosortase/exosortase family protein [Neptunomonas sp. XY-337]